jgi:hypothetical protein
MSEAAKVLLTIVLAVSIFFLLLIVCSRLLLWAAMELERYMHRKRERARLMMGSCSSFRLQTRKSARNPFVRRRDH